MKPSTPIAWRRRQAEVAESELAKRVRWLEAQVAVLREESDFNMSRALRGLLRPGTFTQGPPPSWPTLQNSLDHFEGLGQ